MVAELVPYFDGMQQGQGYDTYLQELRVANAVTITSKTPPSDTYDLTYKSDEIQDYTELAKSLEITAGAAISGWGQSAKVDASYLNWSKFESATTTYQVEVSSQQQASIDNSYSFNKISTTNPHATYGDRFVTGGKFLARVSISSINKSSTEEVKQAATVALTMYGATGEVTEEVKNAVSSIQKNSRTTIWIHISGGGNKLAATKRIDATPEDGDSPLFEIKKQADNFYQEVKDGKHKYRRFGVLWKYTNVPDFNNAFDPFDYTAANKRSWNLFEDFTQYGVYINGVKKMPVDKFLKGRQQQADLYDEGTTVNLAISNKVEAIDKDPTEVDKPLPYPKPYEFQRKVLLALKTVAYIAQERTVDGGSITDIALPTLYGGAEKLFEFKAFDFDAVIGTSVVSFGRRDSSYICLNGQRAGDFGYQEESVFWTFPDEVEQVAEQKINVSKVKSADLIRLSRTETGPRFLFDIYTEKSG
ncbi:hypothetical protein BDV38DRAFT_278858 [Aspergillus pseudotamarii]|uniref:Uncharacterized protein n=1 Tax=Aspergillus pseudotamarii TaxID=132259 RepID=A0A5N6T5B4_ASPPS|nr:uncharacterized protein BDV38DRAFT_278858 [Aspergillus pseudotamarii]KAE8141503.1 hypothetical protein BDV38DRAFT_278858 [Aspergillus pseudotamarii]